MADEKTIENDDLLSKVAGLLESDEAVFDDQKEFIIGILFLILNRPFIKKQFRVVLSENLTTEIEGVVLDKIAAVINKTYLMKGESATINDDTALELISGYLFEHDEFIFHKNKKRLLKKPKLFHKNKKRLLKKPKL